MTVAPLALLILLPFLSLPLLSRCSHRQVIVPGDIILGGLFPIHAGSRNASGGSLCGRIKADQGVQRMVAMLFALEAINNSPRLLPGLRLGTQILDTCSVETHALEQSLEFIKSVRLGCAEEEVDGARQRTLLSMDARTDHPIRAASSQVSVMVASMLQLFKIPMLSYSSTGVELSERPRFAYFSRVVPPDNLQAKAMAHLVAQLDWNYVHAIVDTGSYGERGMDSFRGAATELGICIEGEVHKISRRWTDDQFEELLIRMRNSKARGVVMFVDEDNLRRFLSNLKRLAEGRQPELRNNFWFVASDSWGMKGSVVKGFEHIVNGAITVAPKVRFLNGFDEYFASLSPSNTFLSEYWQSMNCSERFHPNFGSCFQSKGYKFMQEAYVPFVYDAVQLVARALHSYIQEDCGLVGLWEECPLSTEGFDGQRLQHLYRNVSLFGQPPLIGLNGDGTGQYNIFQIDSRGVYRRVGGWMDNGQKELDVAEIRLGLQSIDGNFSEFTPLSVCSLPCPRGQYRAYQDQNCCWTCIPCDTATAIVPNQTSCVQCPLGEVPNPELTACHQIVPSHLDWDSPWALVPALFSSIGLLATSFVTLVFLRFNYTPVVMASGRELCYCMLAGIALCYSMTFVLVSRPSELICTLTRLLPGLSMSTVYAAILVKTNRLARVFKPNNALRPKWIGPTPQVFFCIGLASVQLAIASIWLWLEPPGTAIQYPSRIEAVLTCRATISQLLVSLFYCGLLIIACTIYAFKTRKIPENFNETRLIGFTMYSTSLLWLSFGPIYFATQNNFKIQLTSLCMAIALSGTVALACFFCPKVYICLFQPFKNVRTRSSAVGKLVNQQMRFISQITSPANDGRTATSLVANSEFSVGANCSPSVGVVHPALRRRSSAGALFSPTTPEGTAKCTALYPEGMGRRFLRRMETIATGAWADDSEVTAIVRPHNGTIMRETDQNAYNPTTVIRKQSDKRKSSMAEKKTTNSAFGAADGGKEAERRSRRRRSGESSTAVEKGDGREGEERGSGNNYQKVMSAIGGRKANGTVPRAQSPPAEMNNPVQLILREISGESATFL
uniref:G-protein coupled receptors family 3 profile domain-containing protein n=1 Tax=Globodera rostochiensis TaxID=31243 RepID=A0A914H1P1_GLORO